MADAVCAYCRQHPPDPKWRPFCSERCKMADLGRWLKGDYRIRGASVALANDAEDADDEE